MAKRKKQTENQKAYQKERRRLLQAVRKAKKQGYIFPEDVVPELPKRVTKKQLEKIQKIKPKDLYKKAEFVYQETGEIVPAEQRKQEVKQEAIIKAKETRKKKISTTNIPTYYPTISIIDKVDERLNELFETVLVENSLHDLERKGKPLFPIEARKSALIRIFDDTKTMYEGNENELEQYLKENEGEIFSLLHIITWDSDTPDQLKIQSSFSRLATLLNTRPLTPTQAESVSWEQEYY